jgi:hypothetical protein
MNHCKLCHIEFAPRRRSGGEPQLYCPSCSSSGAPRRVTSAAWKAANPERCRAYSLHYYGAHKETRCASSRSGYLKRRYGITPEVYDSLLVSQSGLCAICRRPPGKRRLAVDHDHTTGAVRALLCNACNVVAGFAETSGVPLRAVEAYLLLHTKSK